MSDSLVGRLRLASGLRYYGDHVHGCPGGDAESCRCGFADLLEKLEEQESSSLVSDRHSSRHDSP